MVSVKPSTGLAGFTPDMAIAVHCFRSVGLDEMSYELLAIRKLRDKHMMGTIGGCMRVSDYFFYAPAIVEKILERDDLEEFTKKLLSDFYSPIIAAIDNYEHDKAVKLYDDCFRYCSKELGVGVGTG